MVIMRLLWLASAAALCVATLVAGCNTVAGIEPATVRDGAALDASDDGADDAADDTSDDAGCNAIVALSVPPHGGSACPGEAASCWPHDLTTWTPRWADPVGRATGACTVKQIDDYYLQCQDPSATLSTCQAYQQANSSCYKCLFTPVQANRFGPLIDQGRTSYVNIGGCVAVFEPCNLDCAKAMNAFQQCSGAACDPYCNDVASAISCGQDSENCPPGGCAGYTYPNNDCLTQLTKPGHPSWDVCLKNAPDFASTLRSIAIAMCGP
jgi:hypothetical protein